MSARRARRTAAGQGAGETDDRLSLLGGWAARTREVAVAFVRATEVVLTNGLWDRLRRSTDRQGDWRPWQEDGSPGRAAAARDLDRCAIDLNEVAVIEAGRLRSPGGRRSASSLLTCGNGARVFEVRSERVLTGLRASRVPTIAVIGREVTASFELGRGTPATQRGVGSVWLDAEAVHQLRNQLMGASMQAHLIGAQEPCRASHERETAALASLIRQVALRLFDNPASSHRQPAVRRRASRGPRVGLS